MVQKAKEEKIGVLYAGELLTTISLKDLQSQVSIQLFTQISNQ